MQPKLLKSLQEVVIHRDPGLIDTFLPKVLEFQVDKSAAVRKGVLDFCDASLDVVVSVTNLLHGAECILFLLEDDNVSVLKRCIRSLLLIFQCTLAISAAEAGYSVDEGETLWKIVQDAVRKIENLIKDSSTSTGVKLSASKFLEQAILLATGDRVPCTPPVLERPGILPVKDSIVTKQDALKIGNEMLATIVLVLKDLKNSETHGPLTISCIRSSSQILQLKPQFAGKLVPILLSFSQIQLYQDDEKVSSALGECLGAFGSSENRLAAPWRKKISDALVTLGLEPLVNVEPLSGLKRAREPDSQNISLKKESVKNDDEILEKYEEQVKSLLLVYDAEGLFNFIQNIPSIILADLTLEGLRKSFSQIGSYHVDLIRDRICNLMLARLKEDQDQSFVRALPTREFKNPLDPVLLDDKEASYQRLQTLKRILSHSSSECSDIKPRLVARLGTSFPKSDNAFHVIVESIMQDYHGLQGHQTFCLLLVALFAELTNESDQDIGQILPGSRYEEALQYILEGMYQHLPPSDKSLASLLVEIPAVSSEILLSLLERMIDCQNGWDNTALLIARDVILHRPKNRKEVLDLALESCISNNETYRVKAIRMCTNQLYNNKQLRVKMETDALRFMMDSKLELSENEDNAVSDADRFTSLYCALCTKNSILLREIFKSFPSLDKFIQLALMEKCPNIAAALGPNDKEVLDLIQSPPAGSQVLINCLIQSLSSDIPPKPLVESCLACFEKYQDPECIVPILPSLGKKDAIKLIPFLIQLPEQKIATAIKRLCVVQYKEQESPVISPGEILAVLHMVDDKKLLKYAMVAINTCLGMTEIFTSEVLAASLSQLITRIPLPQLFMRTVLQSLSVAPKLKDFIVGILGQLASRQIWTNQTQWRGWIMAAQQTSPESFPTILRLPPNILEQVLLGLQKNVREGLVKLGLSSDSSLELSDSSMKVLYKYTS